MFLEDLYRYDKFSSYDLCEHEAASQNVFIPALKILSFFSLAQPYFQEAQICSVTRKRLSTRSVQRQISMCSKNAKELSQCFVFLHTYHLHFNLSVTLIHPLILVVIPPIISNHFLLIYLYLIPNPNPVHCLIFPEKGLHNS